MKAHRGFLFLEDIKIIFSGCRMRGGKWWMIWRPMKG
jgi:hypothetical protein